MITKELVVVSPQRDSIVVVHAESLVSLETFQVEKVLLPDSYVVLEQVTDATTILTGVVVPREADTPAIDPEIIEELMLYSKRTDFASESIIYKGEAQPGTAESSPNWRIRKLILAEDGDVTELWASGSSSFDKVWSDRTALSYS